MFFVFFYLNNMNYKIITDEDKLLDFINWLPDLEANEKFYCCLFSRKKYYSDLIKSNEKSQLKRFLSNKERLFEKIKQLETEIGSYRLKELNAPQESLALYLNPNPRDLERATYDGIIKLTELLKNKNRNFNPHSEILSCIQRSRGRKIYLDFDIDTNDFDFGELQQSINSSCLKVVKTRGGFHILVKLSEVEDSYKKTFYTKIMSLGADQTGDQLLPIPGCVQGGFTPHFIENF